MQNRTMALHADTYSPSGRYVGVGFVVTLHVVVLWAILNALNFHVSRFVPPPPTHFHVVKAQIDKPQPVPAPPTPTLETLSRDVVRPPVIDIQPDKQASVQPVVSTQPAAQPQSHSGTPDSAALAIASTHTTPPYPPTARRFGQQGTVILVLSIDASGKVVAAHVKQSSGSTVLDSEAESWVVGHWRYKPAISNGAAVPSTTLAAVKFDLRQAD